MSGSEEPTKWLSNDEQSSWRAYIMGTTLLLDRLDRELRQAHDISLTEYEILVRLSETDDQRMRMSTLADAMCHSRSRVTHTVARMERAGWLTRAAAEGDGRGVEAIMTPRGLHLLEEAAHTHVTGVREHLVDVVEPKDFRALGVAMNAVSDRLLTELPAESDIRPGGRSA